MPISKKGTRIMRGMKKNYGPVKPKSYDKGFYGHYMPSDFQQTNIITTTVKEQK